MICIEDLSSLNKWESWRALRCWPRRPTTERPLGTFASFFSVVVIYCCNTQQTAGSTKGRAYRTEAGRRHATPTYYGNQVVPSSAPATLVVPAWDNGKQPTWEYIKEQLFQFQLPKGKKMTFEEADLLVMSIYVCKWLLYIYSSLLMHQGYIWSARTTLLWLLILPSFYKKLKGEAKAGKIKKSCQAVYIKCSKMFLFYFFFLFFCYWL